MMGRGDDAVASHQSVLSIVSATAADKSAAHMHIADAQNMMGLIDEAHSSLKISLEVDPGNLDAYYQLVQVCKEKGCWQTPEEWGKVVAEMETALLQSQKTSSAASKKLNREDEIEDDDYYYDDYEEKERAQLSQRAASVLDATTSPSVSIYWALFEACHKKGVILFVLSSHFVLFPCILLQ